ncbi:sensory transduction protein kinase AlgZ [Salinisphaera dokdonensis CL-ES53]|uniref:Sensory transduction protein kinase AlgZ n=1 Tax=Salinisphaera dokdonensis CL-ES53 TaxID=1304272 RepID=A0ABV2B1Z7_9GAMM
MNPEREPVEFLPDFCTGARVLRVLVVCEAVAVVLALGGSLTAVLPERFLLLSIYLQWIGICSAAALCLIKRYASRLSARGVALLAYLTLLAVTFAITEITYVAGRYSGFALLLEDASHDGFVARSVGISAVVAALALRYFWLRSAWQSQAEAEMRARLEALQARIEPHFLFNSLNSVAALIAVRPDEAENALEDLAVLLRARLATNTPANVSLDEEMAMVDAYVRIESLRMGERLTFDVRIDEDARACQLPALSLQPLVENAIGHGVARLPDGGTVVLQASRERDTLVLQVVNPLAGDAPPVPGNRQALVNIRHRLALRYGDVAELRVTAEESRFTVDMIVPQPAESVS